MRRLIVIATLVLVGVSAALSVSAVEISGRVWTLTEAEQQQCDAEGGCAISTMAWLKRQLEAMFAAGVESQKVKCGRSS